MGRVNVLEPFVGFQRNATHTDSRLVNATVISVKRGGVSHDQVTGTPVGRQYKFIPAEGKIKFDINIPFDYVFERLHIIYKT